MRYGPTSLQLSSVLAKGLHRPKLRDDLRISEQQIAGKASFVVKDPINVTYHRYGPIEYELLRMCDGTRTPAEVAAAMSELHPESPLGENEVLDFLDGVEANLWVRSAGEKNLAMLERIRDERKGRLDQSSLLYIQFKAWNPNRALERMDPYLSWMYTWGFAVFSIVIFVIAMSILAGDWTRIEQDTSSLYSFAGKSSYDLWAFWIIMLALGGIHELAHGLTCKHYGGEVPQMGFMLIYFTPAFYTDTTDILIFDTVTPRQLTIFAGIWIELVVCSLATFVWALSFPGSTLNDIAYKVLLLSGIQGAMINLNPLIKADGYYALAQYLQMDSLREDSFEFMRTWARKYLLRQKIDLPPASRRQRRIFFVFSVAAIVYSVTLLFVVLVFVNNVFVGRLGDWWGYVATAALLYLMFRGRLRKAMPHVRARLWKTREAFMRWKMTRAQQVAVAAAALVLFVPPFSSSVSSGFILEPGARGVVRASVSGQLRDVRVRQGDRVHAGEIVAELTNPDVEANVVTVESELGLAESTLRSAEDRSSWTEAARAADERARLTSELSIARTKLAELVLRAPIDGVITADELPLRPGEFLGEGQEFVRVFDRGVMRARILVHDWALQDVVVGAPVRLKVTAEPYRTYAGRVQRILPAAALDRPISQPEKLERQGQDIANYFAVEMEFPNPDGSLREGMTGMAKISGTHRPLAWQAGKAAWRWLRSQIW